MSVPHAPRSLDTVPLSVTLSDLSSHQHHMGDIGTTLPRSGVVGFDHLARLLRIGGTSAGSGGNATGAGSGGGSSIGGSAARLESQGAVDSCCFLRNAANLSLSMKMSVFTSSGKGTGPRPGDPGDGTAGSGMGSGIGDVIGGSRGDIVGGPGYGGGDPGCNSCLGESCGGH